jgi:hypothetical protein
LSSVSFLRFFEVDFLAEVFSSETAFFSIEESDFSSVELLDLALLIADFESVIFYSDEEVVSFEDLSNVF